MYISEGKSSKNPDSLITNLISFAVIIIKVNNYNVTTISRSKYILLSRYTGIL
jgi:hypothetical protein